jgi:hypothetical protein
MPPISSSLMMTRLMAAINLMTRLLRSTKRSSQREYPAAIAAATIRIAAVPTMIDVDSVHSWHLAVDEV